MCASSRVHLARVFLFSPSPISLLLFRCFVECHLTFTFLLIVVLFPPPFFIIVLLLLPRLSAPSLHLFSSLLPLPPLSSSFSSLSSSSSLTFSLFCFPFYSSVFLLCLLCFGQIARHVPDSISRSSVLLST
eukprot:m.82990 g.82990  ORF g.82990 m.82990 type:complete len:131 (+) comp14326_c2_seq1:209-601(+)